MQSAQAASMAAPGRTAEALSAALAADGPKRLADGSALEAFVIWARGYVRVCEGSSQGLSTEA